MGGTLSGGRNCAATFSRRRDGAPWFPASANASGRGERALASLDAGRALRALLLDRECPLIRVKQTFDMFGVWAVRSHNRVLIEAPRMFGQIPLEAFRAHLRRAAKCLGELENKSSLAVFPSPSN